MRTGTQSILPALLARAKVSVCTTVGLAPSADERSSRAPMKLPCPAPCRARVAPSPQRPRRAIALLGTPAPSNFAGRARTRRANPVAVRRRSIFRATHCALPARLPHYADYILRLQDTESFEINAAPSARRITTRRRLAGVRQTGAQRPPVRGAISASARGAISAQVPPSSPSRHARSTR